MSEPLEGIRVIDCTQVIAGPLAGAILGDLGADVIKIEDPVHGDMARTLGWESVGRNKRGMTLDFHKEASREIMRRLVQRADVFTQSFRSYTVAKGFGVDYDTISGYNPKIVYCYNSSWGPEGPDAEMPGWEPMVAARSGLSYWAGELGSPPATYNLGVVDPLGGVVTALAILAALVVRERQGIGQRIDTSLFGSVIYVTENPILSHFLFRGVEPSRRSRKKPNPIFTIYRCADDKWIQLGMHQADKYWSAFCKAVGHSELEKDPRFENIQVRVQNSEELVSILDEVFATKDRHEWEKILRKADLMHSPVRTVTELTTDPQALANQYIMDFNHPSRGPMKVVGFPFKFHRTPASLRRVAPEYGQHTEEILLELGYDWNQISKFKDEKVV